MPQLDVATYASQLFWLAVTFIVLLFLMSKLGLPRVRSVIEARGKRIDDDLGRAEEIKNEAEAAMAAYQRALADARAQAQTTIRERTEHFAAEAAERQRQLTEALKKQTSEAELQIIAAKDRAFADIRAVAVDVARSITEKLTGAAADEGILGPAVDRVLAERSG
jgi:F-type H+-transporting ATPase subunit b